MLHASTLDRRNVNEHIGAAVILNDKAIPLLSIEEFNRTCGHHGLLIKRANASLPIQDISHGSHIRILRVLGEGPLGRNYKGRRNREWQPYSEAADQLQ
jgi:hypothetical protein